MTESTTNLTSVQQSLTKVLQAVYPDLTGYEVTIRKEYKYRQQKPSYQKNWLEKNDGYFRDYYLKHKETYKEKIECEHCKKSVQRSSWNEHVDTRKHKRNIVKQENEAAIEPPLVKNFETD